MNKKSGTTPTIVLCEQDLILGAGLIGAEFFNKVLGMSIDEVLVTDDSDLSDFSFCGEGNIPVDDPSLTLNQAYRLWDAWVITKIKEEYDLELVTTRIRLVTLFAQIEALANSTQLLH